jgi:hypothetical protein
MGGCVLICLAKDEDKWRAYKPTYAITCGEFLDRLRNHYLPKKDCLHGVSNILDK